MFVGAVVAWVAETSCDCNLSGVPFTEKQALLSRGDDYRDYQSSTSMFFPWFPRSPKE